MGSQETIKAVIDAMGELGKRAGKDSNKGIGGLRELPGGSEYALSGMSSYVDKLRPAGKASLKLAHETLSAHILKEGLPAPPAWTGDFKALISQWKAWWKANSGSMAKKLGELDDDAPARPARPVPKMGEEK